VLVAVVLLRSSQFVWSHNQSEEQLAQESVGAFAQRVLSKRIAPAILPVSTTSQALDEHVLEALESLPKDTRYGTDARSGEHSGLSRSRTGNRVGGD
jgi:hypothetical protein